MIGKLKTKLNYFHVRRISRMKHIVEFNLKYIIIVSKKMIKKLLINDKKMNYPLTLQYPITNKCNLNCIMCNIHANDRQEIPLEKLEEVLSQDVFKKISSAGINGGEPFIMKDIDERIKIIINTLPSLKRLYIITNGTYKKNTLEKLKVIKAACEMNNIILTVSFSIDGYGDIHDYIRGIKGTFNKLMDTVSDIILNKEMYCDELNFICTITSKNVYELPLLDEFMKSKHLNLNYNIATDHERLKNHMKFEHYSLLHNEHAKMVASEFLYSKYKETGDLKYYSLFHYLNDDNNVRIDDCSNLKEAITLTANGDICYCATHSKVLGNVLSENLDITDLYFKNEDYNNSIKKDYCPHCSHYIYGINAENYKLVNNDKFRSYHRVKL